MAEAEAEVRCHRTFYSFLSDYFLLFNFQATAVVVVAAMVEAEAEADTPTPAVVSRHPRFRPSS
jgi:hypothetical protein